MKPDKSRVTRRFNKWIITAVFLIVTAVLLPAFTLAPAAPDWTPEPLRNWAYDTRLAIGRPLTTLTSLAHAVKNDPAFYWDRVGQPISFTSEGLTIAGTLYDIDEEIPTPRPGILLLHGSTPQGRKLGLYRLLGQKLAQKGYVVLAIDQRGYGRSDDPPDVNQNESFNFVADVRSAISYFSALPQVDPERIFLIGHSFGGDVAMTAVIDEPRVRKLVLIGPGRRFTERGGAVDAPEFEYFKRREMRYMRLAEPIPAAIFLQHRAALPLENHRAYFAQPDHVPTLLIDGGLESEADREFLQAAYESMAGEKAYVTLDQADHYANTANLGPAIIYDSQAVDQLLLAIDTFLASRGDE